MDETITHPRFTLRFGRIPSDRWGHSDETRAAWILDSTLPGWTQRNSGHGNVNNPEKIGWAKEWAAEDIRKATAFEVVGWTPNPDDQEPFWAPRLVHVVHGFVIVDTEGDRYTGTAKTADDADAIQDRILHGSKFVRIVAPDGSDSYVNLDNVFTITYAPIRTEVPA